MASVNVGPAGPAGPVGPNAGSTGNTPTSSPSGPIGQPIGSPGGFKVPAGFKTSGWYMFVGITAGIMLGGTRVGPVVFGILTLALIYQTGLMLEGK